jgi:N-acetylglucosamine transport system substrate-binding protein
MKKLLSMILASVMVLSLLAGCGGGNNQAPNQNDKPQQSEDKNSGSAPSEPSEPDAPAAGGSITVAALASGYEEAYPGMWQEVCDAFTAETGIEVELIVDKMLEDVIGPAMQGGDFPDVIHLATGREKGLTEQFIKDNNIAELTDVLSMTVPGESAKVSDKIVGGFTDTSVTNPYGDGKTYLAPMFYSPCGLFYNAGLFEEKGWSVPTTWDEMWELGDKAAAEDISLFTYPTTGYFDAFFYALMYSVGGPDFYNKALVYDEGIWDTPEGQQCFEIVSKLASYTNPVTPAQANDQDFTQNQQLVLDNKALFMPNGTWIVGEMAEAPRADGFKWGMTALPAAKAGGNGASYCWLEQAWVPAEAPNLDAAKQFVAFLYSDKACEIFAKGGAIQPVPGLTDSLEGDNKMFYSIYDNGADAAMGNFAAYNAVAGLGTNREEFFDPVNGLVNGSVSQEEWVSGFKAASDQMRENIMG